MNRGDKTTIEKLSDGARFTKPGKKVVFELLKKDSGTWSKASCLQDGKNPKHAVLIKIDTEVIFLRQSN
jgi:hypothetical protein